MKVSQKSENRSTLLSSSSTSGYLSEKDENTNLKRYMHSYVHCNIIYNSQDMETTEVSFNGLIDKEIVVYICIQWNIIRL